MSEAAIRARHIPNSHYRFSPKRLDAGSERSPVARERIEYVLSGACSITIDATGEGIELGAQEFATLPAGTYRLVATGDEPLHVVTVFPLPESVWTE
jgi:quercetin dioxygenase-like cupin family protein